MRRTGLRTKPPAADPGGPVQHVVRVRIQAVASDLYVRHGYDGFSFADIAGAAHTTRANIHYHFGTKQGLMTALINGFVTDATTRIASHWTRPGDDFATRWRAQCDDLRRFYMRFNPEGDGRNVWSPLARLRLDMPALGRPATDALDRVNHAFNACLRSALLDAVASRELLRAAPVDDLIMLLRTTILSCGALTQDQGSFAEVDLLFAAVIRTIAAAWGTRALTARAAGFADWQQRGPGSRRNPEA